MMIAGVYICRYVYVYVHVYVCMKCDCGLELRIEGLRLQR
jgi:hypothetical protein